MAIISRIHPSLELTTPPCRPPARRSICRTNGIAVARAMAPSRVSMGDDESPHPVALVMGWSRVCFETDGHDPAWRRRTTSTYVHTYGARE